MAAVSNIDERPQPAAPDGARAPRYVRFSRSPRVNGRYPGARAEAADGARSMRFTESAAMAQAYADAIVSYWETARAAGGLDPGDPLYVLDLEARNGGLVYLLIQRLRERATQSAAAPSFCCLASATGGADLDRIASHPFLAPEIRAGRLDTVRWKPGRGGELYLRHQRRRVRRTVNPVVVLANHAFGRLTHDLFGDDDGRLLEGRVALADDLKEEAGEPAPIAIEWRPLAAADWLPRAWAPLLAWYTDRLGSAPLLLPSDALHCLDDIAALTGGRYLLLGADDGVYTEREIRAGACADLVSDGGVHPPVNFHALASYQRARGARVWSGRFRDDGPTFHVAVRERGGFPEEGFAALVRTLERGGADDCLALAQTVAAARDRLAPEQLLAILRLGHYEPRLFEAVIEPLLAQVAELTMESRERWCEALERVWASYFPDGENRAFALDFGLAAMHFGQWGLAKQGWRLDLANHGPEPAVLYHLAYCEAASGQVPRALASIERALALDPQETRYLDFRDILRARLRAWERIPWYRPDQAGDGELTLEPLGAEHAGSLLAQYRDPQIGVMTRLPELDTLDAAADWIAEQNREPGRIACAVMHEARGFAGVVSLRRKGGAAYFYFWIGTDHQGAGLGQRAAELLFRQAARDGIEEMYTSAYPYNSRSMHALERLGFARLSARARPPDEDLVFFHKALAPRSGSSVFGATERLRALLGGIDSAIEVVPKSASGRRRAPAAPVDQPNQEEANL